MENHISALLTAHPWILGGGYFGMFVIMLFEGPGITVLAGFAAKTGLCNVWMVFLVSILGNFIPDVLFYAIGYWGQAKFIDEYGHLFRITRTRMEPIKKLYENHSFSALLVVKMIPFLPPAGLAAAGVVRMPIGKYSLYCMIIIVLTSGAFLLIGYYAGETYAHFARYQGYVLGAIAAMIVLVSYGYKKSSAWIGRKWGKKLTPETLS